MNFLKKSILIYFFFFALGVVLRFQYINDGIWTDEWISFFLVSLNLPLNDFINLHYKFEGAPILYGYINFFFHKVFSTYYQNFELFLFIVSILFLPLSTKIFQFKDDIQKKIFFLLISLNPILAFYSGEIRFYTLSVLFSSLSFYFYNKILKKPKFKYYLIFFLIASLSISINFFSIILILSFLIFSILKKNKKLTILIISILILFLIFNYNYFIISLENYFGYNNSGLKNNNSLSLGLILNTIGLFFNSFFGNKVIGFVYLLIFSFTIINLIIKKKINDQDILIFLIIILSYFSLILFVLFFKFLHIRHYIFLTPFLIFIISQFSILFEVKKVKIIILLFFFSVSVFFSYSMKSSYMFLKPNPKKSFEIFYKNNQKYNFYIKKIKKNNFNQIKDVSIIYDHFNNFFFKFSKDIQLLNYSFYFEEEYLNLENFVNVCLYNPKFRSLEIEKQNCSKGYFKKETLTHEIIKTIQNDEFKLVFFKKKHN